MKDGLSVSMQLPSIHSIGGKVQLDLVGVLLDILLHLRIGMDGNTTKLEL